MFLFAAGFLVVVLALSIFIGPKKITDKKTDPFECGTIATGDTSQRFGVKYYLVAVLFILFDIEIVFLYPWAVNVRELGWVVFGAVVGVHDIDEWLFV